MTSATLGRILVVGAPPRAPKLCRIRGETATVCLLWLCAVGTLSAAAVELRPRPLQQSMYDVTVEHSLSPVAGFNKIMGRDSNSSF